MAHFAEIKNNIVQQVVVTDNSWTLDQTLTFLIENVSDGEWLQCSYNSNIRNTFPGVGYEYDPELDIFRKPKKYDSWILTADKTQYKAPKNIPDKSKDYLWNEGLLKWELRGHD